MLKLGINEILPSATYRDDKFHFLNFLPFLFSNPSARVEWAPTTVQNPRYLSIKDNIRMANGKFYGRRLEFLKNLLKPVMDPEAKPWDIFDLLYLLGLHDVHF